MVGLDRSPGVGAGDSLGLFFALGLDGAERKSSGMSFQFSVLGGTGVLAVGMRGDAETDFGGGGGRFTGGGATDDCLGGWSACGVAEGFLSHPVREDWTIVVWMGWLSRTWVVL